MRLTATAILLAAVAAQTGPTFDVVSIKRNTAGIGPGTTAPPIQRPDGGFKIINTPIRTFVARAYPGTDDIVGLPDWATSERYDIAATSTLTTTATADERVAMLRAMLADRCKLVAHVEKRQHDIFEMVLARKDGKLGSGLTPSVLDCSSPAPAPQGRQDLSVPPPPCTIRTVQGMIRNIQGDRRGDLGDVLEGESTLARLAEALRFVTRRPVIDKTGLAGSYKITMNFDMMATMRPPSVTPPADNGPSVFTAIEEQLGLKLVTSKALRDTLIIDRLERPTSNEQ